MKRSQFQASPGVTDWVSARYRLTASSAARNQRAVLIDAVEVGSIGLGELGDAPEGGVLLHVWKYRVAFVDEQVAEAQGLQFAGGGAPYARRTLELDDFRRVRECHPAAAVQKDFHLHARGPGRVTFEDHLVEALRGGELHLKAGVRGQALPSRDRKSTRLNSSHLGISYAV